MNTLDLFHKTTDFDEFRAGQVIFEAGKPGDTMYVIKEGEVEIKLGEQSVLSLQAGEIFGEMALIDTSARSATAVARTDCRLIPITQQRFTFLIQQTPFFSIHVMRILVNRIRKMNEYINSRGGSTV